MCPNNLISISVTISISATWFIGTFDCRRIGLSASWLLANWIVGDLVCRRVGLSASWFVGELSINLTSTPCVIGRRTTKRWHKATNCIVTSLASAVQNSQYQRAFRHLLAIGPAARRAFNVIVHQQVRRQIRVCVRTGQKRVLEGEESIRNFAWENVVNDYSQSMPILYSALCGAMPSRFLEDSGQLLYVSIYVMYLCALCISDVRRKNHHQISYFFPENFQKFPSYFS